MQNVNETYLDDFRLIASFLFEERDREVRVNCGVENPRFYQIKEKSPYSGNSDIYIYIYVYVYQ